MGKQSLPFPHAGREIPQKNSPSPIGEGKLKYFFSRSGKWEKNLFPFHKKSLILLILVGKNSFFSDFFSCGKGNSKKSLSFPHAGREIPQKKFRFLHGGRKIEIKFFPRDARCEISHPFPSLRDHPESENSHFTHKYFSE